MLEPVAEGCDCVSRLQVVQLNLEDGAPRLESYPLVSTGDLLLTAWS